MLVGCLRCDVWAVMPKVHACEYVAMGVPTPNRGDVGVAVTNSMVIFNGRLIAEHSSSTVRRPQPSSKRPTRMHTAETDASWLHNHAASSREHSSRSQCSSVLHTVNNVDMRNVTPHIAFAPI